VSSLTVGTFTRSVLLDVARTTGALDDAGLTVTDESVPSSPAQFRALADGQYDAILTNPDNVIAYRYIAANPLGENIDAVITAAIDRGLGLTLCLRPGLASVRDVRTVGVDVGTSGFAFLAYSLLDLCGLPRDRYDTIALGATPSRARALVAGECDATILNAGNELTAIAEGCSPVARACDVGPYIASVVARLESCRHARAADDLAAVLVTTAGRISSGELHAEVIDAARRLLGLPAPLAEEHYRIFLDSAQGLVPGGRVDVDSIDTVLALRRLYLPSADLATVGDRLGELLIGLACMHAAG
jgi:ABC-type nitrate/sulfonate/bicarbonate transport system substrate-binding protein